MASNTINTSFVERNNGKDRAQNARKVRKTYRFSKDWDMHNAAFFFIGFSYNFCWPVRTLRHKDIVDYKLSHGQKFKFDMLQLAIYSELLRIHKHGLKFRVIIEYYEPELHESFFHSSKLTDLFSEIVRPVLEELAAMQS